MYKEKTYMPRPDTIELARSKEYLTSFSIQYPEDASPASLVSLIQYIRRGNGTQGKTPQERIMLIQQAHDEWIGKRVTQRNDNRSMQGVVKYLLAKVQAQVLAMRRALRHHDMDARTQPLSPFRAGVLWDDERQIRVVDLDHLTVLPSS